jgi:ribosome-binding protein aMBF1 (putative translation factor)
MTMKTEKRSKREAAGSKVGSADEFLGLSPEETALVNIRLALAARLKKQRLRMGLSQVALAQRLGSSQSRVAKMEAAGADVSLDLLVRAMLATGAKPREVGHALAVA